MRFALTSGLIVSFALSVAFAAGAASGPLTLVKNGQPQAVIVHSGATPTGEVAAAVNDLRQYVKEITGAVLTVTPEAQAKPGPAIHVGRTKFVEGLNLPFDKMDRDTVILKRVGDNLVLAGKDDWGTRAAAHIFLEDVGGMRWFMPGPLGRVIPKSTDLAVETLDRIETPSFISRDMSGIGEGQGDREGYGWVTWNRVRARHRIGHNIGNIIDPALYGKDHPEYYPLIGGRRAVPPTYKSARDRNWQPCLSNPDVQRLVVEAARKFFDETPGSEECFRIAQNDNYGWCECAACKKANAGGGYDELGHANYSPIYFAFANRVAAETEKTHPGRKLGAFSYYCGTILPPPFVLHRNIVICADAGDHSMFHFHPEFRKNQEKYWKSWEGKAAILQNHNFHYGAGFYIPRLELRSTQDLLRFFHKVGVREYYGEEYPNWGLEGPKTWITAKLLWNVNADLDQLLDDYCAKFFGPAAAPMRKFYDTLEAAWNAQPVVKVGAHTAMYLNESRRQFDIVTPEITAQCVKLLAEAAALAKDELPRRRIAHIQKTFRITELYVEREELYRHSRPSAVTPQTLAQLAVNVRKMDDLTQALAQYIATQITNEVYAFCRRLDYKGNLRPLPIIDMSSYYCDLGRQVAEGLAKTIIPELKAKGPAPQKGLVSSLQARFDELTKGVKPEPGPAWTSQVARIQDYLGATALVPKLKTAPTLDGKVRPEEWAGAPVLTLPHLLSKTGTPKQGTQVRMGYDAQALYVAYTCQEADVQHLIVTHDGRDSSVWEDDCADFCLLPPNLALEDFRHFIVNAKGVYYDAQGATSSEWNTELKIAAATQEQDKTWTIEAAIPWTAFNLSDPSGTTWRAQFGRIKPAAFGGALQGELSSWAPTPASFNNPDYLGVLLFE